MSAVAANRATADKALASAVANLDSEIAAAEAQAAVVAAVRIRASSPTSISTASASSDSSLMDAVIMARRHADFDVNTTGNYLLCIQYTILYTLYTLLYVHSKALQKATVLSSVSM
jgi:hypothetical protein